MQAKCIHCNCSVRNNYITQTIKTRKLVSIPVEYMTILTSFLKYDFQYKTLLRTVSEYIQIYSNQIPISDH